MKYPDWQWVFTLGNDNFLDSNNKAIVINKTYDPTRTI